VDSKGNITQTFPQYDHLFKRPHFVAINPYDPDNTFWIVDDHMHAIYKFTHDMKELVQTLGTPTVKGADGHALSTGRLFWCGRRQHLVRGRWIQRNARRQISTRPENS